MPVRFPFLIAPFIFFGYILLEIAAFIFIGSKIGVLMSLFLVLSSSIGGIWWLKENFKNFTQALQANINNEKQVGLLLSRRFIGGLGAILLILPGFISSFCGLLLIIPFIQDVLVGYMYKHNLYKSSFSFKGFGSKTSNGSANDTIIDLDPDEYHSKNPEDSPWRNLK